MSMQAMGWAFAQDIPDPLARLVLLALANCHNQARNRCFPTIAQIEKETSLSERTVQRKIDVLIATGFITVERTYCPESGRQRANEFVLHTDGLRIPSPAPAGTASLDVEQKEGVSLTGGGCQPDGDEGVTRDGGEGVSCGTPYKEPEEIPEEKTLGASAPKAPAPPDRFEELWAVYPDREGPDPKKPARAAFASALKRGADPGRVIAAARRLAAHHPKPTRFIPRLTTWLNEERYVDEAEEATAAADRETWANRLRHHRTNGYWHESFGPEPGRDGCLAPADLLTANFNRTPRAAAS